MVWLFGCSTPHAIKVRCDDHLVPINGQQQSATGGGSGTAGGFAHGAQP